MAPQFSAGRVPDLTPAGAGGADLEGPALRLGDLEGGGDGVIEVLVDADRAALEPGEHLLGEGRHTGDQEFRAARLDRLDDALERGRVEALVERGPGQVEDDHA